MTDLYSRLPAAVEERRAHLSTRHADYDVQLTQWALLQCERDLKVLERHRPTSPVLLDMAFIPPEIAKHLAEVMEPMCAGHGHHVVVDPGATWPCPEIRDMAPVYGIEVSDGR